LLSKAFAEAATPVKTARAISADTRVFMIVPLDVCSVSGESSVLAVHIWRISRLRKDAVTQE
jgi:hypothetical protein